MKKGEALEALGPAMGNNSTSSHQLIIARLGQMGDPRATPVLLDLLDSTNRSVAQQTVQALAQLKDPLATERIIEIANGPDNYAKQYLNGYINNGFWRESSWPLSGFDQRNRLRAISAFSRATARFLSVQVSMWCSSCPGLSVHSGPMVSISTMKLSGPT